MLTAGVTAEYNVFHNGHAYQLRKIKEQCDAVVIAMSGSFVQRGGIAVTDKWQRAEAAVRNGADLVIELPVVFALSTAQKFAYGAVCLLEGCGVDRVYFGSESGDINALKNAAMLLENEPEEVSRKIKLFMSQGQGFAAARSKAYEGTLNEALLREPNNILAVEYIRALIRRKNGTEPVTIKRIGAGHKSDVLSGNIASASSIRKMIINGDDISGFVPCQYKNIPYSIKRLESAVICRLRSMSAKELSHVNEAGEGIENRIIRAAGETDSLDELLWAVSTKRYTESRIRRLILSALLGLTKELTETEPSYIRVLALNSVGAKILRNIKNSGMDIITKTADYRLNDPLFKKDILATDLAALCAADKNMRRSGLDYIMSPVYI